MSSQSLLVPRRFGPREAKEWFHAWSRVADVPDLEIRLQSGASIAPAGIVVLAAGIGGRKARRLGTTFGREPGSDDAFRYLQRTDFFACFGVETGELFERHDERGRFVPLQRITDLRVARDLADRTADLLEHQSSGGPGNTSPSVLRMARFVFEELAANVVQHSGAPETGFGQAQVFPTDRRLQIAFADAGMGFLASLRRNPEWTTRVENEAEALQFCLSLRVTGAEIGRKNMGLGLFQLQSFADALGGDLWIASGDALLRRHTTVGTERANVVTTIPPWQGTWICLDAPLP